ncbi:hypothetical protein V9T40_006971 [Parthenolecanium corni]|uniref:SH3 domain-containing protein n=1 Tax=Parthenolecanium corni TaxID=536013 RepID=A0AAN9TVN0_9HEMI
MNGILKNALKKYTPKNNEEWEDLVNDVVSNYNNSPITHFNNKSPFYLIHGYNKKSLLENKLKIVEPPSAEPRLDEISDVEKIRDEIPKLIEKNAMRNKQYYDKNKLPSIFHPNSLVLVRQAKNLSQTKTKFDGPYRVVEKLGNLTYLIKIEDKIEQIHVRRLIEYNQRNKDENKKIPPPLNIDEELGKIGRSTDNLISSIANDIPIDSNPKLYSEPPKSPTRKCLIDKPVLLSRIDSGFEPCIINFNNEDFNDFTFPIADLKMGELPSLRYWKLKFLVLLECYEERNRINQVSSEPESDETDYDENYSEVTYHHNEVVTLPSATPHSPRRHKINWRMKSVSLDSSEPPDFCQPKSNVVGSAASIEPHSSHSSSSRLQSPSSPIHNRRLLSAKPVRMSSVELPDDNEKSPSSASNSPIPSPMKPQRLLPTNLYAVWYNFKARHADELDLKAGYKVTVIDMSDIDWWKGKCLGKVGYFPSKYVTKLQPGERVLQVTDNLRVAAADNSDKDFFLLRDQIVIQIGEDIAGMIMFRNGDNQQGICPLEFLQEV